MPLEDRSELLEAVAYSDDPSVSTSDRLRALELLDRMPDTDETALRLVTTVQGMTDKQVERDLATFNLAATMDIEHEVSRRVKERTKVLRRELREERNRSDDEVERRVAERLKARGQVPDEPVEDAEVVEDPRVRSLRQLAPPGIDPDDPGLATTKASGPRRYGLWGAV